MYNNTTQIVPSLKATGGNMDKGKVLRTDLMAQLVGVALLLIVSTLSWLQGQLFGWTIVILPVLVIWQFFSGIYIAVEFKMLYRGVPPGALLVLVTLGILFAATDFSWGLFVALCLVPFILLSNVILAAIDWHRWQSSQKSNRWHSQQETILDTEFGE